MKLLLGFWEGKCSSVAELQDNIALVEGFKKKPGLAGCSDGMCREIWELNQKKWSGMYFSPEKWSEGNFQD